MEPTQGRHGTSSTRIQGCTSSATHCSMPNVAAIANSLTKIERKALRLMPLADASTHKLWPQIYRLFTLDLVENYEVREPAREWGMKCTALGLIVRDYVGKD